MSTDASNLAAASWFKDEGALLGELRRVRRPNQMIDIPGYDDLAEVRRGGQGVVYAATQRSTKRRVAIKVLLNSALGGPAARRRFEREIDLVASMRHANIVRVYDSGCTDDGHPFLVMEFVEGASILDHLRAMFRGASPASSQNAPPEHNAVQPPQGRASVPIPTTADHVRAVLEAFAKIASALAHAHQRGVIHRDLKPSNIRVDGDNQPRVLDFGLAKVFAAPLRDSAGDTGDTGVNQAGNEGPTAMTLSGQFMGSLPWASPEQARGNAHAADTRSDVYSLGVMLYQALTGRFPYDVSGDAPSTLRNIVESEPSRVRGSISARLVSDDVETIVLTCLAKAPERRYQSAAELERDLLRALAGEPIQARRDGAWSIVGRRLRRYRLAATALGGASVISIAALGVALTMYLDAARARDLARSEAEQRAGAVAFLENMLKSADPGRDGVNARVVDVLDRSAAELDAEQSSAGKTPPLVEATARAAIGTSYASLGQYPQAVRHLRGALELRKRALGPAHRDTLETQRALTEVLLRESAFDEALALTNEFVALALATYGPDDRLSLRSRSLLGQVLNYSSKLTEAEGVLRETLEDQIRVLGERDDDTTRTMNDLAVCLRWQRRGADAEPFYRRALSAHEGRPDSPRKLELISNLIQALHEQDKFEETLPMYRDLLERQEKLLGPEHIMTLTTRSNLGTALIDLGRLDGPDGAEAIFRSTLGLMRKRRGDDAFETLLCINNLAKTLQDQGKLEEAQAYFEEAHAGMKRTLGPGHRSTLITAGNIATLLSMRGKNDEALAMQGQITEDMIAALGPGHVNSIINANNFAQQLIKAGRVDEAPPIFARTLAAAEAAPQTDGMTLAILRGNYARCLLKLDRAAEAEPLARASLAGLEKTLPDTESRLKQALETLAEALEKLSRSDEASPLRARVAAAHTPAPTPAEKQ